MRELITYNMVDTFSYEVNLKFNGLIGYISFIDEKKEWMFLPKAEYFLKGVHLALILNKVNELNNYKRIETNIDFNKR